MADLPKQLRIAVGVATRTKKELIGYGKEIEKQAEKVSKLESSGADPYDIKKQTEVLAESQAMIPDTQRRLEAAVEALRTFLATHGSKAGVSGSPLKAEAEAIIAEYDAEAAAAGGAGAEEEDEEDI